MIITWIIGLILSFLGIHLLKGSRVVSKGSWSGSIIEPERPVLKMWSLFLFILGALAPILNIFMAIAMIVCWTACVYDAKCWLYNENSTANKIIQFLNKPIE